MRRLIALGCLASVSVLGCEAADTPEASDRAGFPDFDAREVLEGMFPIAGSHLRVGEAYPGQRLPCEAGGVMIVETLVRANGVAVLAWDRCGFVVGDSVWTVVGGHMQMTLDVAAAEVTILGAVEFDDGRTCEVDLRGGVDLELAAGTVCGRFAVMRDE